MYPLRRSICLVAAGLLLTTLVVGCGGGSLTVKGKLLKNGASLDASTLAFAKTGSQPLTVTFKSEGEGAKTYPAKVNAEDGTYVVELPPGKYQVNVFIPKTPRVPARVVELTKSEDDLNLDTAK